MFYAISYIIRCMTQSRCIISRRGIFWMSPGSAKVQSPQGRSLHRPRRDRRCRWWGPENGANLGYGIYIYNYTYNYTYIYIYNWGYDIIWGFPIHGGNPQSPSIQILDWDFPWTKPSSYWATPMTIETPYLGITFPMGILLNPIWNNVNVLTTVPREEGPAYEARERARQLNRRPTLLMFETRSGNGTRWSERVNNWLEEPQHSLPYTFSLRNITGNEKECWGSSCLYLALSALRFTKNHSGSMAWFNGNCTGIPLVFPIKFWSFQ